MVLLLNTAYSDISQVSRADWDGCSDLLLRRLVFSHDPRGVVGKGRVPIRTAVECLTQADNYHPVLRSDPLRSAYACVAAAAGLLALRRLVAALFRFFFASAFWPSTESLTWNKSCDLMTRNWSSPLGPLSSVKIVTRTGPDLPISRISVTRRYFAFVFGSAFRRASACSAVSTGFGGFGATGALGGFGAFSFLALGCLASVEGAAFVSLIWIWGLRMVEWWVRATGVTVHHDLYRMLHSHPCPKYRCLVLVLLDLAALEEPTLVQVLQGGSRDFRLLQITVENFLAHVTDAGIVSGHEQGGS